MAIRGNFKIGNKSFAKKSGSAKPQKKDTSGLTGREAAIVKQLSDSRPTQTFNPRSRDAMYASSDDLLQNLIDRKDELKTQSGGQGDDRNLYQVMMNQFKNKNPQNQEAYASRFPIQNFFTSGLPSIASKFMPGAGALSLLVNVANQIKGGLRRAGDFFDGQDDETFKKLSGGVRQGPPAYDASGLAGYKDAIMKMAQQRQTPMTVYDPSMFDPTQADFRQNMAGTEPYNTAPDVFNQESVDPLQAAKDQQDKMIQMYGPREPQGPSGIAFGFPSQFQEGGLASINNPEYNMLMKASDFDV